jgi:lipoprotein NlpD
MKFALALAVLTLVLFGCATRSPAPVSDRRPAPTQQPRPPAAQPTPVPGAPAPSASGTYVVKRGDTLYSIALEHGADYRELAQLNKVDDPSKIRVGQELRLPKPHEQGSVQVGSTRASGAIESRPLGSGAPAAAAGGAPAAVDGATKTSPKALRLPYSEQNLALLQKGEAPPAAQAVSIAPKPPAGELPKPGPSAAAGERDPDAIEFAWPAKGRVLAGFSEASNKGVDIAGKPGDPVLAAAPGRVMYTGTGIRGYGKLIVIKHDNNFNSVYAHNREILVKEGQNVSRGQRIAELGDTDADAPKLHFEIRKSGRPVDPSRYLPAP